MRHGLDGLAAVIEAALAANPFDGHESVFRGRRSDQIKALWFDGPGLLRLDEQLERGRLVWPDVSDNRVLLSQAERFRLLEAIDWRRAKNRQAASAS